VTTVDGLEPTETRLYLLVAAKLGDVEAGQDVDGVLEWHLVNRHQPGTRRRYDRTTAVFELVRAGWLEVLTNRGEDPVIALTELGQQIFDEHGAKVLKRYRETT
jgi:hypothetical protein